MKALVFGAFAASLAFVTSAAAGALDKAACEALVDKITRDNAGIHQALNRVQSRGLSIGEVREAIQRSVSRDADVAGWLGDLRGLEEDIRVRPINDGQSLARVAQVQADLSAEVQTLHSKGRLSPAESDKLEALRAVFNRTQRIVDTIDRLPPPSKPEPKSHDRQKREKARESEREREKQEQKEKEKQEQEQEQGQEQQGEQKQEKKSQQEKPKQPQKPQQGSGGGGGGSGEPSEEQSQKQGKSGGKGQSGKSQSRSKSGKSQSGDQDEKGKQDKHDEQGKESKDSSKEGKPGSEKEQQGKQGKKSKGGKESKQGDEKEQQGKQGKDSSKEGKPGDKSEKESISKGKSEVGQGHAKNEKKGDAKGLDGKKVPDYKKEGKGSTETGETAQESESGEDGMTEGSEKTTTAVTQKQQSHFKRNARQEKSTKPAEMAQKPGQDQMKPENTLDRLKTETSEKEIGEKNPSEKNESGSALEELNRKEEAKPLDLNVDEIQWSKTVKSLAMEYWVQTLRQYPDRQSLMDGLQNFKMAIAHLPFRDLDYLPQFIERASWLQNALGGLTAQYHDLRELGGMLMSGSKTQALRELYFLETILNELRRHTDLDTSERQLLENVTRLIQIMSPEQRTPTDEGVVKAFLSELGGPLSRNAVLHDGGPEEDFSKMARSLRSGEYNDLVLLTRLRPYFDLFFTKKSQPKSSVMYNGRPVAISESLPNTRTAQDLDNIPMWQKEGFPMNLDLLRFFSDDVQEKYYPGAVERQNPRDPNQYFLNLVVYDISGSNGNQDKFVLRNALILGFVDNVQMKSQKGVRNKVYVMSFDGSPHLLEPLEGTRSFQEFFDRFRSYPPGAGGDDSITGAILKSLHMIAENQYTGGRLVSGANVLLITDAVARIDLEAIKKEKAKIKDGVQVVMNAITLGDMNHDVDRMIEMFSKGSTKLKHFHITYPEIGDLLDTSADIHRFEKESPLFPVKEPENLKTSDLFEIRDSLSAVADKYSENQLGSRAGSVEKDTKVQELGTFLRNGRTTKVDSNANLTSLLSTFVVMHRLERVGGWSHVQKLEALVDYLDQLSQTLSIDRRRLEQEIDEPARIMLRQWVWGK